MIIKQRDDEITRRFVRRERRVILKKQSFLHALLCARHKVPTNPNPYSQKPEEKLREALLKCSTLTRDEVEEYLAYEFEGIVYETVPFDYELNHPEGEEIYCLYADGLLQAKTVRRHTNQISRETLEKVQRVLPLLYRV